MKKTITVPGPDKGWSWVVVFAACFTSLVLAGIFRTGGVLFVAFIDSFGATREEASWPMVICITVLNLTGPFSGILGQRFGARPIVMAGAVVGAIGVSTCFFTTSLNVITVLFGGVFGVGYGLVNTLMPVIVNAYFLNLRGLANGIANSGSCFGSVILPVLFEYLIGHYGLSACFLLTGGIVLNVAVAGALLRPPAWLKNRKKKIDYAPFKLVIDSDNSYETHDSQTITYKRQTSDPSTDKSVNSSRLKVPFNSNVQCLEPKPSPRHSLQIELVDALRNRTKINQNDVLNAFEGYRDPSSDSSFDMSSSLCADNKEVNNELSRAQQEFQASLNDFQSAVLSILETSQSEEVLNTIDETDDVNTSEITNNCPARHSFSIASTERPKMKSFKSSFIPNKPLKKCNLKFENSSGDLIPVPESFYKQLSQYAANTPEYRKVSVAIMDNIEEEEKQEELYSPPVKVENHHGVFQSFQSVLSCPMFYVTAFTNVSFYFLFHMYVVIIIDYSRDRGVAENDTKYIIFAFSGADLLGRLCLGWITDRKYVTRSHFTMICMTAIGVVFFTFPFATSYWTLIFASCGYGVLLGCTMVLFPILLVDYLGTELHAVSYGCLCFMNGFASLVRPLIIGYFRDNMGSYANMFYILGIISVVASSAWLLEKCFISKSKDSNVLNDVNLEYIKQKDETENE